MLFVLLFPFYRGSINSLANLSNEETWSLSSLSLGFFNSFTLSAYLRVLRVCSDEELEGEKFPIITVLQLPTKESLSTNVNLLPLKGVWFLFKSNALIHSFKANRDLLISAPSNRVCLFWSLTSAPLSLPARSMKDNFPWHLLPSFREIYRIAWDLEESLLEELEAILNLILIPVTLEALPYSMTFMSCSTLLTLRSYRPTILTLPLASSLA